MANPLAYLLTDAFRAGLLTVDAAQHALREADVDHTSRGHVHALLDGRRQPTLDEAIVLLRLLGDADIARVAASRAGLTVGGDGGATVIPLMRAVADAARRAGAVVSATAVATEDGTVDNAERRQLSEELDGLEAALAAARRSLVATGRVA